MFDLLIRNAKIIDGSGKPAFSGDVAIHNGQIAKVASHIEGEALEYFDALGKVLSPGFIDVHSHTDLTVISDRDSVYKLQQGVTTEITGQCGLSVAPVSADNYEQRNSRSMLSVLMPKNRELYTSSEILYKEIEQLPIGTNVMIFVGQGTIRETVMGHENRPATPEELELMKQLVREAMEAGALGMSSGLAYAPGSFTPQSEIIELCKIVAEYGGVYASHLKNQAYGLADCVSDTIDIARKTGCSAVVSHIKSIGKDNWGKLSTSLDLLDKATKEGLNVWTDAYPYIAGSTTLTVTLPPSLLSGGNISLVEQLKQKDIQNYIKEQFKTPTEKWENAIGQNGFNSILIVGADATPCAVNKTIEQYGDSIGLDPFDAYIKLLIENRAQVITINFVMSEEDLKAAYAHPLCMVGSDGLYYPGAKSVHPRAVGSFPRFLGHYVRDLKLMPLEKAIKKITSFPAEKYFLINKGLIKEGFDADLVLFDYDKIIDHADYLNCYEKNDGIISVWTNGGNSVKDGKFTGFRGGRLIRKK